MLLSFAKKHGHGNRGFCPSQQRDRVDGFAVHRLRRIPSMPAPAHHRQRLRARLSADLALAQSDAARRASRQTISILDVGSGGGDMLRKIRQLTRQRGINAELTGVDLNPWAKQSAEFDTPPEYPLRDVGHLAFDPLRRADYIMKYRLDEVIRQRVAVQVVDEPAAPGVAVHPLDEAHERGIAEVMDEIAVTPLRSSRNQFVEAASSAALCAKSCRYYSSAAHRGTQ